jgi:hypothetical protein
VAGERIELEILGLDRDIVAQRHIVLERAPALASAAESAGTTVNEDAPPWWFSSLSGDAASATDDTAMIGSRILNDMFSTWRVSGDVPTRRARRAAEGCPRQPEARCASRTHHENARPRPCGCRADRWARAGFHAHPGENTAGVVCASG